MVTHKYIGMRYVPIFGREGEESTAWDNSKPYEPLTVVLHQGNSYTSRQFVPAGIDIENGNFWALTGDYNAQARQLEQEIHRVDGRVTANANAITAANAQIERCGQDIDAIDGRVTANANAITAANAQIEQCGQDIDAIDGALAKKNYTPQITQGTAGTVNVISAFEYHDYYVINFSFRASSNIASGTGFMLMKISGGNGGIVISDRFAGVVSTANGSAWVTAIQAIQTSASPTATLILYK